MNNSDNIDVASEQEYVFIQNAINLARSSKKPVPTVLCIAPDCEGSSMKGGRFCCVSCRDTYDNLLKRGLIREK